MSTLLTKIISGGQTGVDRAALDVAQDLGLKSGGWCPRGRRAEDGVIPERYILEETPGRDYEQRTEWNVRDSDATLILTTGKPEGGTALTLETAQHLQRPVYVVDLLAARNIGAVLYWMDYHDVKALNVAGPRESRVPGIKAMAMEFIKDLVLEGKKAANKKPGLKA